jgi:hypothetical protein
MVDVSKLSPATKLSRKECADALTQAGYKTSPRTLATKATRGGGPPYQKWGSRAIYTWGPSLGWAEARLSAARFSTSEPVSEPERGA